MNEIFFNNSSMPVLCGCDLLTAAESFYHADRIVDFNILIYVISGVIYVTEDEQDYQISEGELLFLKNGIHHYGKVEIAKGTRWYFVHFCFDEISGVPVFGKGDSVMRQYEPVRFGAVLPKKLTGLQGSVVEMKIKDFIDYFHSSDDMKVWYINSKLSELLSEICFYGEGQSAGLSDRICDFLGRHMTEPFCAEKLEKHFFLSYKHMAAVFRREKNITMQQYHNRIRMNAAQSYLRSTLMPVGEISSLLGFNDMLYFSRCFKNFTGVSPTEYRKKASQVY
ncbi:MAG: helix-turn-helix transcriptional regulator [Ruminiclostridium sp.]|nr:helix-turn-helix transcriptional regulator [Ruminiclostridium sp.]